MIAALAAMCLCSVIQDVLISPGIGSALMSITLIATWRCLSYTSIFCGTACIPPLNRAAPAHKHSKGEEVLEKNLVQKSGKDNISPKKSQGDDRTTFLRFVAPVVAHE